MNKDALDFLEKLRVHFDREYQLVQNSHVDKSIAVTPILGLSFLRLCPDSVAVRRTKPFRDSFVRDFEKALADHHREWEEDLNSAIQWFDRCPGLWDEDWLGSYTANNEKPVIDLYWLSIILAARCYAEWQIPDVVLVVLLHEWAHAVTDYARDADGKKGRLPEDLHVSEGVAQYWTHYSLLNVRNGEQAFKVFLQLCRDQRPPYQAHIPWIAGDCLPRSLQTTYGAAYASLGLDLTADATFSRVYEALKVTLRQSAMDPLTGATPMHEAVRQGVRRATRREQKTSLTEFDALLVDASRQWMLIF